MTRDTFKSLSLSQKLLALGLGLSIISIKALWWMLCLLGTLVIGNWVGIVSTGIVGFFATLTKAVALVAITLISVTLTAIYLPRAVKYLAIKFGYRLEYERAENMWTGYYENLRSLS